MRSVLRTSVLGVTAVLASGLAPAPAPAQTSPLPPLDALRFAQMKDAKAERVSSSSPNPDSNNDSKQPDPGRDADARGPRGPGRRHAHLADDRGQRVRLAAPDAAAGVLRRERGAVGRRAGRRLLRRRPRVRALGEVGDDPRQLRRAGAQQLLADALREVLPHHADERRPAPASITSTTTSTGRRSRRFRRTRSTSTPGTSRSCRRRRQRKLYTFLDVKGRGFYAGTVLSTSSSPRPAGSARATSASTSTARRSRRSVGTGSEDYFNDAWGLHVVDGPYTGVTVADGDGPRAPA